MKLPHRRQFLHLAAGAAGRSRHWVKSKNPKHPSVKREPAIDQRFSFFSVTMNRSSPRRSLGLRLWPHHGQVTRLLWDLQQAGAGLFYAATEVFRAVQTVRNNRDREPRSISYLSSFLAKF
jgi:hypothetical protein